jgi:hypothetical protein
MKKRMPNGKLPVGYLIGNDTPPASPDKLITFFNARKKNEKTEAFPIDSPKLSMRTRKLSGLIKEKP